MPVALVDQPGAVGRGSLGARLQLAGVKTQAHGTAHIRNCALVGHQVNNGLAGGRIELSGVGFIVIEYFTSKFDHHELHTQT